MSTESKNPDVATLPSKDNLKQMRTDMLLLEESRLIKMYNNDPERFTESEENQLSAIEHELQSRGNKTGLSSRDDYAHEQILNESYR